MTRAQRLRHQKGLERAEENMDKLANKRLKSLGKGKKITERAKGWEDINGDGVKKGKKGTTLEEDEAEQKKEERGWVSDEDMDDGGEASAGDGEVKGESKGVDVAIAQSVAAPVEEEEML